MKGLGLGVRCLRRVGLLTDKLGAPVLNTTTPRTVQALDWQAPDPRAPCLGAWTDDGG